MMLAGQSPVLTHTIGEMHKVGDGNMDSLMLASWGNVIHLLALLQEKKLTCGLAGR